MAPGQDQHHEDAPEVLGYEAKREQQIDSILAESFPASDPPPWTPGVARIHEEHATAAPSGAAEPPPGRR